MGLVVSEIMYHPVEEGNTPSGNERLEFIELYNDQPTSEELSGYAFTNGIVYEFAPGTILGPKGYLVVAREPNAVKAAYGISVVYGPFTGRFNNDGERVELSNANGEVIISFRYNDARPWPTSSDGTGHSLILLKLGGDPEEASSWSASTYIGGTPGGPDEAQVGPPEPNMVTLVDVSHPGRYFKGTKEPSPGAGGVPTIDWTKIGFNDDPSTTEWLNGNNGYGYSGSAAEQQFIKTPLTMSGNYISAYARLRFTLTAEQIASFSQLLAEVHYDDDYVLYLNGTEVARSDQITGNPPPYSFGRGSGWEPPVATVDLTGLLNLLVVGTNVLAIQFHNNAISGSTDAFGVPILRAVEKKTGDGDDPRVRLVINELLANSDLPPGTDWIELYNPGPVAVDLNNIYLSDGRFQLLQYKIPNGIVLQPGEFWTVRENPNPHIPDPNKLPFALSWSGETIYLTAATNDAVPKPLRVLDAVRFGVMPSDITFGRFPDGSDYFGLLSSATYNGANAKLLINDIVINEIMYHHPANEDRYEYIELYNRGTSTVPMNGWAFTDGIEYQFGDISMAPNSYLVVANDPNFLKTVYNNLVVGSNLVGSYTGNLADHSECIRLSYPYEDPETHDVNMVTADEVTYYDGGRWPKWADGQGASLELRDPRSNNTPDAWADSDENSKTTWQQFSFPINSTDSQYTHDAGTVFDIILLNRGEVLLDDLELLTSPSSTNRLSNGGFESGESGWRILGNHVRSFVTTTDRHSGTQSLHLISTGHGDPGANRINRSISSVTWGTVQFKGWAKWLRGTRYLLLRVSQSNPVQPPRPSRVFELPVPLNLGTPGQQNTAYVSNRGPDIREVQHAPVLPAGNEPIVVTARVTDNDGVSSVTLYYRSEGTTTFTSTAMVDNGSGDDLIAGDGIYTAAIPGAAGGTMRAFYIEASDGSASTRFPTVLEPSADVPNRTCLVRVGDATLNTQLATYRVWLSNDVINTFLSRPSLSNELMDCTFVYNNTEVFYNAGIRFRGSPFIRSGTGRDPRGNYGYRFNFEPDHRFRSCEEINLDATEGGNRGPLQERASYWFYRQMELQYSMQEFVRLIINGNNYGNYEDVQNIEGDYIDMWFPDDADGYLHKIDDYFEYTADGTGFSNYDEGLRYDSAHPLLKETYRWCFEKRSHRENDNWQQLFDFAVAMNTTSSGLAYEQVIESVIDPNHFTKVLAIRHAVGDWDSYGYRRSKNNYFYYAAQEGKWYLLPWDIDWTLGGGSDGTGTSLFSIGGQFPEVSKFLNYPKYRQMYFQAFTKLVSDPWQTSYGTANQPTAFDKFLDDASNALIADGLGDGRRDGIKQWVRDRRAYIITQIPPIAFEITTNNGDDFCTSASKITLNGTAPLNVMKISVNGTPVTTQFSGNHVFEVEVALALGENVLVLQGLDSGGKPVSGAIDFITVTRVPLCVMAYATPSTACNSGTAKLTIYGSGFEPGSATSVALTSTTEKVGFDALYVQYNQAFDAIDAATALLDDPGRGVGDPVYAVHTWINLYNFNSPDDSHGEFTANETTFAPPFNVNSTNYAVRFTGYIYASSPGIRYFGVNSDDGFTLSINGQLIGEYANPRGPATTDCMQNRTDGTMTFNFPAAGSYYMVLDFFENGGGEEIELFQTNSTGGDRRLINVDAELVVFRDNVIRIEATDVVVADESTITCETDLNGAEAGMWNVIVTPECEAAKGELDDALEIVACGSDFNRDSQVNFTDWVALADNWRKLCSAPLWCAGLDVDHSGYVDIGDVAIFAEEWLLGVR
jgi:hypothetical protein